MDFPGYGMIGDESVLWVAISAPPMIDLDGTDADARHRKDAGCQPCIAQRAAQGGQVEAAFGADRLEAALDPLEDLQKPDLRG